MLQSPVDIAIVAGVILLIFGPKKVPEFGKALGQGIGNFKRALFEAQDEVKTALNENPAVPKAAPVAAPPSALVAEEMPLASNTAVDKITKEELPPKW